MFYDDQQDQTSADSQDGFLQNYLLPTFSSSASSGAKRDGALEHDSDLSDDHSEGMKARQHERYAFFRKARWDFFTAGNGLKTGYVLNISKGGCLLKACEPIEHRRWVRIMIQDHHTNVFFAQVGRIVRRQDLMESVTFPEGNDGDSITDITLYRYGVEFTHPSYLTDQDDLILALSSKNLSVRSCRSLNSTSSLRPGSLA
jgi:hypothetical protein